MAVTPAGRPGAVPASSRAAARVEDIDDLMILTFELNHNELSGLSVNEVPAVKFYPKHDKSPFGIDLPITTSFEYLRYL